MKLFLRIMIIAAVILPPLPAAAREDGSYDEAFEEEEILIEAERPETPGLGEPGQTTTVTRAELEASGARTLAEFLQRIPGVKVNRQGGVLEAATLSIRGSSANQVLVLVDGVPQNDLWGGGEPECPSPGADRIGGDRPGRGECPPRRGRPGGRCSFDHP